MTLNADIQTRLAGAKAQMPPPVFAKLGAMFDRLEAAHVGTGAPKAGQPAPDTRFTSRDGSEVTLASLHADGPLMLIFYRGRWCPFCDLTLRAFDVEAEAFKSAGARLVGVSPQTTVESVRTADERDLHFEVFSDPHNAAGKGVRPGLGADRGGARTIHRVRLEARRRQRRRPVAAAGPGHVHRRSRRGGAMGMGGQQLDPPSGAGGRAGRVARAIGATARIDEHRDGQSSAFPNARCRDANVAQIVTRCG